MAAMRPERRSVVVLLLMLLPLTVAAGFRSPERGRIEIIIWPVASAMTNAPPPSSAHNTNLSFPCFG
jgi:hypothetical protein